MTGHARLNLTLNTYYVLYFTYIKCPILHLKYPTHTVQKKTRYNYTQLYRAINNHTELYTAIESYAQLYRPI